MRIVVLAGGLSMERNVSLSSGTRICRALRARGHQAALVDLYLGLEGYDGAPESIFDAPDGLCGDFSVAREEPDLDAVRASRKDKSENIFGKDVLRVCAMADVVFIALHGACGEDGRVQAAFDLLGIPYTGSGYLGSAIAMDKDLTKRLVAPYVTTAKWRALKYTAEEIETIADETELPCVVKPNANGSSIGVTIAHTRGEVAAALTQCLRFGAQVVIESCRSAFSTARRCPPSRSFPRPAFMITSTSIRREPPRRSAPRPFPRNGRKSSAARPRPCSACWS